MNWNEWKGKKNVFIKLEDGQVYSNSRIVDVSDKFLCISDKFGFTSFIRIDSIIKINEEVKRSKNE